MKPRKIAIGNVTQLETEKEAARPLENIGNGGHRTVPTPFFRRRS